MKFILKSADDGTYVFLTNDDESRILVDNYEPLIDLSKDDERALHEFLDSVNDYFEDIVQYV